MAKQEKTQTTSHERPADTVNLFDLTKITPKVRSESGGSVNPKIAELINSSSGCSVHQAGTILHGSLDNWKKYDPAGKGARTALRTAWRATRTPDKAGLAITNTAEQQVYFNVPKNAVDSFREQAGSKGLQVKGDKGETV